MDALSALGADQLLELFDLDVPAPVVEQLGRACIVGYQEAATECDRKFSREVAHDVRPQLRRANIENRLPLLAGVFRELKSSICKHTRENAYYTELRCGRVVITVHRVPDSAGPIPWAQSRVTLASRCQLNFFEALGLPGLAQASKEILWAAVIHGSDDRNPASRPDFINVVFPFSDGENFFFGCNVYERFQNLLAGFPEVRPVTIADEPRISLTRRSLRLLNDTDEENG